MNLIKALEKAIAREKEIESKLFSQMDYRYTIFMAVAEALRVIKEELEKEENDE